jgi:hypothetical protein
MKNDETTSTHGGEQEIASAVAAVAEAEAEGADPALGDDFFAELAEIQRLGQKERAFADGRDLFNAEHREQLGVWRPVPFLRGAEVLIAHQSLCLEKRETLEARFREKYKIPVDQPITGKAREAIMRESFFGTAAKDWRGVVLDGQELPFTAEHFRKYMTVRRFRIFISTASLDAEAFRADRDGKLRGNS